MNGPPKQAEKVISGSFPSPTSVPAILDVYPEMNWYNAWSGVNLRDGRHDTARVAGEKDDILRMSCFLLRHCIADELQRIGCTRIFCDRIVIQID